MLAVTASCKPAEEGAKLPHLRHLLETELTVANDNNTYPNATLNVRHCPAHVHLITLSFSDESTFTWIHLDD
jgi:hypothetical protein